MVQVQPPFRAPTLLEMNIAELSTVFENAALVNHLALYVENILSVESAASIFNHANLTVAKAASIFNNANLTAAKAASVFDHANLSDDKASSIADLMTSAKILAILNTGSLTDGDKIGALLDGDPLAVADAATHVNAGVYAVALYASAFSSTQLAAAKAASIFDHANITVVNSYNILAHGNLLADKTQSIMYLITLATKLVDILTSGAGDLTVAADQEIAGVQRYGTVTVNVGKTLTLTGQPSALIAKTIANSGNIVKQVSGGAAGLKGKPNAGDGGQGAGGFVIFADVLGSSGIISADGEVGENAGVDTGGDTGGNVGGDGAFHSVAAEVPGTGGDGAGYGATIPVGGVNGGGGGSPIVGGGDGGGSTLTTSVSYAALADKVKKYVVDWVIENVFIKAPTVTMDIDIYGSGGGGGGDSGSHASTAGGGGSGGGEVLALCLTLNNTGTIRANGGVGGDSVAGVGLYDNEGGGGGGGLVYALYVSLTAAGTLQANGAAAGTGDSNDTPATAGGNGVATSQAV